MAERKIYKLDKNFPVVDYKGREVSVLNWVDRISLGSKEDLLDTLVNQKVPYGTYCIEDDDNTQYFEYFDHEQVPDAQYDLYFYNSDPLLGAFGIQWASTETVGKRKRERFIGPVYSTMEALQIKEGAELSFIGDLRPDDFMEMVYEQFRKEKAAAQKKRRV